MRTDAENKVKFESEKHTLKPLKAQVGGHVYMKILNDQFVCKPLNIRELKFYQSVPSEIVRFVPTFIGTLELENDIQSSSSECNEYLVLDNLTQGFQKPCILDLKMGTRMYSDSATDSKRKSQRKKSKTSTSAKLGVRFCGSQRFSISNNSFEMLDKYIGRDADEYQLRRLLEKFFTLGGALRRDVLNSVLCEISSMKKSLADLEGFRFYSSSLLIIYEGMTQSQNSYNNFLEADNSLDEDHLKKKDKSPENSCNFPTSSPTVKIIDFANVSLPFTDSEQLLHVGPDRGFLMGLDNLQEILESLREEDVFE